MRVGVYNDKKKYVSVPVIDDETPSQDPEPLLPDLCRGAALFLPLPPRGWQQQRRADPHSERGYHHSEALSSSHVNT